MKHLIYGLAIMNIITNTLTSNETNQSFAEKNFFEKQIHVPIFFHEKQTKKFLFKKMPAEIESIGSKALNLAFLDSLGYVSIPSWASVSSSVFREVVHQSPDIQEQLELLYSTMEKYDHVDSKSSLERQVFQMAFKLRADIENLTLPDNLIKSLTTLFNEVSERGGKAIAVRSSALTEDLPEASFAGLYDSYLNICDFPSFCEALKKCWASTFNDRAVQYYMQKHLSLRDVYMSVVVMELVPANISGTAFTTDITTGYNGIHIMANYGLEGVVGGDISADSFLLHPESLMILKRTKGSKAFQYIPKINESGLQKKAITQVNNDYCLSIEKTKELAFLVKRIANDYQQISKKPIDTEFAITENGEIFLVQIRPVVMTGVTLVDDIDFSVLQSKSLKSIATGKHAVFGVKHGRIKIIEDFKDLEMNKIQIHREDIVVTPRTENQWTQYLSQFSGIITNEGNPTSHPVLISREKGVPCLVGVADVMNKFRDYDGQWITLDGFRKCAYVGKQPLKKVSIETIKEAFNVIEEEQLQEENEMIQDLFSKNFMIESEGKYWITGITSYFSGALLDMVLNAYKLRESVINKSGIEPPISFQTEQCILYRKPGQGKIYDHWWTTHEQQLEICQNMTIENYINFFQEKEKLMQKLVQTCKNFDLTLSSWKKIRSVYEELTAYQLLGFLERYPLIHNTYKYAKFLEVPRYFFEECVSSIPNYEWEEDIAFSNATKVLAKRLLKFIGDSKLEEINLNWIEANHPEYYESLKLFSTEYKFLKSEDWSFAPPLDAAFVKVVEQAKSQDLELIQKQSYSEAEEEFFVDNKELQERIRLCIVKKLQQNNIHHVRPRAQWFLREKFLELGKYLVTKEVFKNPEEIFYIPIEKLESYIHQYEKEEVFNEN